MTKEQFDKFKEIKEEFKRKCKEWTDLDVVKNNTDLYVVYNTDLDKITQEYDIKLILVADNPGEKEKENEKYLCENGQAGNKARKFFSDEGDGGRVMKVYFDKNIVVLNKTPIFTKTTADLEPYKDKDWFRKMTEYMAEKIAELHQLFDCKLWIVGKSYLKKPLFRPFSEKLEEKDKMKEKIFVYNHFSYNWFNREITNIKIESFDSLDELGRKNFERFFHATNT
jgi:hypothetical protein